MQEIIINGGALLDGCPKSWDEANAWTRKANQENEDNNKMCGIKWDYDCRFKLDFDGELLRISSRFYPPEAAYGSGWDGTATVYIGELEVEEKSFDCKNLEELRVEVETYVQSIIDKVKSVF